MFLARSFGIEVIRWPFLCIFFNVVFQCSTLKQVIFFVIQFCCSQGSRLANGSLCRGHSATVWSDVCWHHLTSCIYSGVDDIFKKRQEKTRDYLYSGSWRLRFTREEIHQNESG